MSVCENIADVLKYCIFCHTRFLINRLITGPLFEIFYILKVTNKNPKMLTVKTHLDGGNFTKTLEYPKKYRHTESKGALK